MGKASDALRDAGYRKLPSWWATEEQIKLVEQMVKQNGRDINRIRAEALSIREADLAWRQHEEQKK
jgi:hypothetical protein